MTVASDARSVAVDVAKTSRVAVWFVYATGMKYVPRGSKANTLDALAARA